MILPDVNVLVYAFRREADQHERYAAWLAEVVAGGDEIALNEHSLVGLVRIVTNARIMADPAPVSVAWAFVDRLIGARRARWLPTGPAVWRRFGDLTETDRHITGNLVPDAYLAALALTHGCRLATADRGFARYPGLDWFNPTV